MALVLSSYSFSMATSAAPIPTCSANYSVTETERKLSSVFLPVRKAFDGSTVGCQRLPRKLSASTQFLTLAVKKESQSVTIGTRAPHFELLEPLTGKIRTLDEFEGHTALVVMFICNHCPFVLHVRKELINLSKKFIEKGVAVVAISSNSVITHPQDGPEQMAEEARKFAYPFPYLYDETQEVAKAYKAACTPDFYVYKKDGRRPFELAYHGQLDDSRPSNGIPATGRDLRAAIEFVTSGRPNILNQKPSIGCNIKWAPGNEPDYF